MLGCLCKRGAQKLQGLTFFPGLPSMVPVAFLMAPLTLSLVVGFFLVTRPPEAFARGLEVFALGLATPEPDPGFFELDLVLVLVFVVRVVVVDGAGTYALRGAACPVEPRVRAISQIEQSFQELVMDLWAGKLIPLVWAWMMATKAGSYGMSSE